MRHGTDNENRLGPTRGLQAGVLSVKDYRLMVAGFCLLAVFFGISLIYKAFGCLFCSNSYILLCGPPLRVPGLGRCLRIPFLRAAQHLRVLFPDEAGDFRNPADPAAGFRSGILHYWRAQCQQHAGQGKRCRLRKAYDCRKIRLAQSQDLPFRADHRRLAADDSLFEHYFRFPLGLSLFLVFAFVYPALALHCQRRRPGFGSPTEIPLCLHLGILHPGRCRAVSIAWAFGSGCAVSVPYPRCARIRHESPFENRLLTRPVSPPRTRPRCPLSDGGTSPPRNRIAPKSPKNPPAKGISGRFQADKHKPPCRPTPSPR